MSSGLLSRSGVLCGGSRASLQGAAQASKGSEGVQRLLPTLLSTPGNIVG